MLLVPLCACIEHLFERSTLFERSCRGFISVFSAPLFGHRVDGSFGCVFSTLEPAVLLRFFPSRSQVSEQTVGDLRADLYLSNTGQMDTLKRCMSGSWFNHVLEWWEAANADPEHVLFLHYEAMVAEPEAHIRKIAEFAGIEHTPEIISKVKSCCWMRHFERVAMTWQS